VRRRAVPLKRHSVVPIVDRAYAAQFRDGEQFGLLEDVAGQRLIS
jgi:hypothetical protein